MYFNLRMHYLFFLCILTVHVTCIMHWPRMLMKEWKQVKSLEVVALTPPPAVHSWIASDVLFFIDITSFTDFSILANNRQKIWTWEVWRFLLFSHAFIKIFCYCKLCSVIYNERFFIINIFCVYNFENAIIYMLLAKTKKKPECELTWLWTSFVHKFIV